MRPLRIVAIILVFITLSINFVAPTGASAQQTTNCLKLSAADCKIFTAAMNNVAKLTTFQPAIELTLDYRHNSDTVKFVGTGTGAVDLSEGVLDAIETEDQKKLIGAIKLALNVNGTLTTTEKGKKTVTKPGFKLAILDGNLNLQTSTDGKSAPGLSVDLATFIEQSQNLQNNNDLDPAMQKMLDDLTSDPDFVAAVLQLPLTPNFFTLARTANGQPIEKQRMIEYTYTYDFALLFRTREMNTVMKKFMDYLAEEQNTQKFTTTQINLVVGVLARALNGTTLKMKYWVGAQDNLFHAYIVEGTFNFRGAEFGSAENLNTKVTLKIIFNKIGEPVTVTAPE